MAVAAHIIMWRKKIEKCGLTRPAAGWPAMFAGRGGAGCMVCGLIFHGPPAPFLRACGLSPRAKPALTLLGMGKENSVRFLRYEC